MNQLNCNEFEYKRISGYLKKRKNKKTLIQFAKYTKRYFVLDLVEGVFTYGPDEK